MPISNRIKNQHLLWRAAFGPMAENVAELDAVSQPDLWQLLTKTSAKPPVSIDVADSRFDGFVKGVQELSKTEKPSKEQKRAMQKQYREDLKSLNLRWLDQMINSEAQFREKMSLFWHGHFACRVINIYFQQQLLDVIRTSAFGNFGDMLREVSKTPAMLQFLNNQQNKKQKPNENFAREVMELFTMGRGNYSEKDVKEAARAFTGWGFNVQGEFMFRENQHDDGSKTFLGQTGRFDGDDIIDILLQQKQTANFITRKVYRYFVNEKVDETNLQWLSDRFYKNKYDIGKLMHDIFTSEWFYQQQNIGSKIKSPVELLVGIRRLLPMELENNASQLLLQRALGQVLFYPPNVAGWPGGRAWIDSSTLMLRLRIPQVLAGNESLNIQPKPDDDVMMGQMTDEKNKQQQTNGYGPKGATGSVDWQLVNAGFEKVKREELLQTISAALLQTGNSAANITVAKYLDTATRQSYIKSAVIHLMSTPEYQLC